MLNTKPHRVTHGVDGDALTLVFYPDTGCLRFVDARGICHELRPPHSWFAISSASRGVRCGTQAVTDGLNALLQDFRAKRPRWLSSPVRLSASAAADWQGPSSARLPMPMAMPAPALADAQSHAAALAPVAQRTVSLAMAR